MHSYFTKGELAAYIGDGKGKTSAAVGQLVRAAGHGVTVRFIQFMKNGKSGEIRAMQNIPGVETASYGLDEFYLQGRSDILKHREYCSRALHDAGRYTADLIVLDEVLDAVTEGLITEDELVALITNRPRYVEMILTGRKLSATIEPLCTLISDIRKIRHYYDAGIPARRGIEY